MRGAAILRLAKFAAVSFAFSTMSSLDFPRFLALYSRCQ